MFTQQPLKEMLRGPSITPLLHQYINHFTILIYGSSQIMLFPMDLNGQLINEESIALALVFSS